MEGGKKGGKGRERNPPPAPFETKERRVSRRVRRRREDILLYTTGFE